jgi:chromosomal replication initiation ATPase DnaA
MIAEQFYKNVEERQEMQIAYYGADPESIEDIALSVCKELEIDYTTLQSKTRRGNYAIARKLIANVCLYFGKTPKEIFTFLKYRDHSTISTHKDEHPDYMMINQKYKRIYRKLTNT